MNWQSLIQRFFPSVKAIIVTLIFLLSNIPGGGIALAAPTFVAQTTTSPSQPNILVIFGDDIGWFNVSAYSRGIMGYQTPNIDRVAKEGMMFTDYYAENSCTAGRAAFITGQSPVRTGLTKVGLPGADLGIRPEDPTIAELLKPLGYATGQFGKNHLGDKDEFLPTNHGFDEFFGNLYHLNAEEEPENPDYPKDPAFREKYGPRGVLHSYADGRIENTGPLNTKRMEIVDQEFLDAALNFIDTSQQQGKPFFTWYNSTRMHIFTHLKPESQGITGQGIYADGMVEHDATVGKLLDKLDDLGIADNTIVIYTTDNGAEVFSEPDGGMTPFRGEKDTNWEGGFRVPAMIRWPGHIPSGVVSNEIVSGQDWLPTLLAATGEPESANKLLKGYKAGKKTFKVHLDGYNLLPYLTGQAKESPRKEFLYFTDDGDLASLRYKSWKVNFLEQRAEGLNVWSEPLVPLRAPRLFNLRQDPFEKASYESENYGDWYAHHMFVFVPAQAYVAKFLETFKDFPPRQKTASFGVDQVLAKLQEKSSKD